MLTVSPQAFGFVSCLICIMYHSPFFSNICDQCNSYMHKLLQRMAQLRDNLVNMSQNSVYNNVYLGCDCRFHNHQRTCDGPQMFTFRWVGNVGSQSSTVRPGLNPKVLVGWLEQILTSDSDVWFRSPSALYLLRSSGGTLFLNIRTKIHIV